jgi:transposase
MSSSIIWIGMDVHKDTVMVAVFRGDAREAEVVQQLPNDLRKLRRFFQRWQACGEIRACYEASGAGYVLHRELTDWGLHCDVVAPSLTPVRPGEQRKHDRRDAIQLGRLYRAGELVTIRIPTPAEERVRDLIRCREGTASHGHRSRLEGPAPPLQTLPPHCKSKIKSDRCRGSGPGTCRLPLGRNEGSRRAEGGGLTATASP